MIIEVTVTNTKKPMWINTDKIIKFYELTERGETVTVIDYDMGNHTGMLTIVEEAKWLKQMINVKDPWVL